MTPKELLTQPYLRCCFPMKKGVWVSYCVELACCSMGNTAAEAWANIEGAMELWFESMLRRGQVIPAPLNLSGAQLQKRLCRAPKGK